MRIQELKVKVKSLAAEASIIRIEERKAKRSLRWANRQEPKDQQQAYAAWIARNSLNGHRRGPLRSEQRHSLLAYGFLRGRKYLTLEHRCRDGNEPDWDRVKQLVGRFGGDKAGIRFDNELKAWREPSTSDSPTH